MTTDNTVRVSLRIPPDILAVVEKIAGEKGVDPNAFMQNAIQKAVYPYLPEARQKEIDNAEALYAAAQEKAREVYKAGKFDEHFTLTVISAMMADEKIRKLYETVIEADAYTDGAPKKTPVNMYLGWYIKNAVDAEPVMENGKPCRAFVRNQPIKSYTLLTKKAA